MMSLGVIVIGSCKTSKTQMKNTSVFPLVARADFLSMMQPGYVTLNIELHYSSDTGNI